LIICITLTEYVIDEVVRNFNMTLGE